MDDQSAPQPSVFHPGEQTVQERMGVRDIEEWARRVVRPELPTQHREFHTTLPFLVVAARDDRQRPWATLLAGPEGFVTSPDDTSLVVRAKPTPGDALADSLEPGTDLGILGIELATRRRNRVNGHIRSADAEHFEFKVDQAFGNCPQYIRERQWYRAQIEAPVPAFRGATLTAMQTDWITAADTFFIASGYRGEGASDTFGMDASHRGGDPGFVAVESPSRLVFPDYAGNNHFNTIGNLVLDSRAGLLFVDFATGSLLQLTGDASIDWDSAAVARIPGARRLVTFDIDEVVEVPAAVPLRWDEDAESVRSLRLIDKIRESDDVTSFVFEARDGGALPDYEAGQHLPIELEVPDFSEPVRRTYSLSGDPSAGTYRISVKRESHGVASRHLHDRLEPGAIISTRSPAGDFVLPCSGCSLVLVSAGVGLTPMVSMLHALTVAGGERPIWYVHGARDGHHHPLSAEVRALAAAHRNVTVHVAFSRPQASDTMGRDYDGEGRVDGALLSRLVADRDAHYLMCGPVQFMASVQADLERGGVAPDRIHSESFGPKA